jgi:hypothetical protein
MTVCSRFSVLAVVAWLFAASTGRADVFMTKFEVEDLPGVYISVHAPIGVTPNPYRGVLRIVDTNTGATYIDRPNAQYGIDGDVWIGTVTFSDVSVTLHVLPDGSYELGYWDVLNDQFYYYTGTGVPFVIRP